MGIVRLVMLLRGSSTRWSRATLVVAAAASLAAHECNPVLIDVRPVGTAGNPPDTTCVGAVAYAYGIGRTEITNAQYARFLNHVAKDDPGGLYHPAMGSDGVHGGIVRQGAPGNYAYGAKLDFANKPVTYVSWLSAARFVNWLSNGQPFGPQGPRTTEDGTYDLSLPVGAVVRNPCAAWVLPTEDEWYKVGYHVTAATYTLYPGSDTSPSVATCDATGNVADGGGANYDGGCNWQGSVAGNVSSVGTTTSVTAYGTVDQGGNVSEWTEGRVLRGGAFDSGGDELSSGGRVPAPPTFAAETTGFRVARIGDTDRDGVQDGCDNCASVTNGLQCDGDTDGYGNHCDCDLEQNGICGFTDFDVFLACYGQAVPGLGPADDPTCAESDMNCDGVVDDADFALFQGGFGSAPGPSGPAADRDVDGVPEPRDDCSLVANPEQCDADADGFGNHCDCDLEQNGICGFADFDVFLACYGQTVPGPGPSDDPTCAESDMNCDGIVDDADFELFRAGFGGPPGPGASC